MKHCPVCNKSAVLVGEHNRYFHLDGSNNQSCWRVLALDPCNCRLRIARMSNLRLCISCGKWIPRARVPKGVGENVG
jgi:hypothetical protein